MKKSLQTFVAIVVMISIATHLKSQQSLPYDLIQTDGLITKSDLQPVAKTAVHPVALRALQRGEKKGEFSKVSYSFASNVKLMPSLKTNIQIMRDGVAKIRNFTPHPDTIYVDADENSDLVFRALPLTGNEVALLRPSFSSVFSNFTIEQEEIKLTLANTTDCVVANPVSSKTNQDYNISFRFDSIEFVLDSTKNGDKITVTLDGLIQLTNPTIEGKYTKNNGYRLVFKAAEKADLKIISTMKFSKEYKKLLWGTEVKIKDLGRCDLGLFLLIKANGEIRLVAEVNQAFNIAVGVHGSTNYYYPGNISHISDIETICEANVDIYSKMTVFAGLRCTAKLKIKSFNVLDLYVDGGAEATVETENSSLVADVGLRTKSAGKVFSYKFTLFDKYYSLWKYKTPDMAGYDMIIHEACAFGDFVAGEIHSKTSSGKHPYKGNLFIVLQKQNNTTTEYITQTNENGVFVAKNIPLKNGDKVRIKLPNVANLSNALNATIPFSEIKLYAADYFNGSASGFVAGSKSDWYNLASQQNIAQQGRVSPILKTRTNLSKNVTSISQSDILKKMNEFKNNIISYKGPVEFITRDKYQKVVLKSPTINPQSTRSTVPVAESVKLNLNKGRINTPLGMFNIDGLQFKPNQEVKARIEIEGFTIESDWIETEGLMISGIEHIDWTITRGASGETYRAENSFVLISPIRNDKVPEGEIRMLKGVDVPHTTLKTAQKLNEFPEAQKAVVFFDVTTSLHPLGENSGTAIASSNNWLKSIPYLTNADALNPAKNGKHPFELISFKLKGEEIGYKLFVDICSICENGSIPRKINNLQSTKPGTLLQPDIVQPINEPVKQPSIGGGRIR